MTNELEVGWGCFLLGSFYGKSLFGREGFGKRVALSFERTVRCLCVKRTGDVYVG